MSKFHIKSFMFIAWLFISNQSYAAPIEEVADMRILLIKAIDSDQEVIAFLKGEMAEKIKKQTGAPADTEVKVNILTVEKIRPGCKRLQVVLSEPTHMMQTKKGTSEPFSMWYQLNLCRDGKPPQLSSIGLDSDTAIKEKH